MTHEKRVLFMREICTESIKEMENRSRVQINNNKKKQSPKSSCMKAIILALMDNYNFKNCGDTAAKFQQMYENVTLHTVNNNDQKSMNEIRMLRNMLRQVKETDLEASSKKGYRQWLNKSLGDVYNDDKIKD
jgi:flagellin-specific chaperone FliS